MSRFKAPEEHAPRWQYDCTRCKFNWCCGYTCHCNYYHSLPEPPDVIQELVDSELLEAGLEPQFKPRNRR